MHLKERSEQLTTVHQLLSTASQRVEGISQAFSKIESKKKK